jgi:uncharacterized protein (DUF2235 family)
MVGGESGGFCAQGEKTVAKNILIFSDGTGQAGGFMPDETRSNVYKLYRATRVCPDTNIKPEEQLAFYDAGLGSRGDVGGKSQGFRRRIYNILSQATGLGITQNIIDCYAAIVRMWEPGDRIFLFGFSRGAYTARCVAGVLYYCGVPTKMKDGSQLRRDPKSANIIATGAVKEVYQYGSSIKGDPLKNKRMERAFRFRSEYGSGTTTGSNGSPYFIGVWDTVATLGAGWGGLAGVALAHAMLALIIAFALSAGAKYLPFGSYLDFSYPTYFLSLLIGIPLFLYVIASLKYKQPISLKTYRMAFYNTNLDPAVAYARHALSIDENRKDFPRVPWAEEPAVNALVSDTRRGPVRFKQIWFAGNHSDVGGSYAENESRLSDISLSWMVEEATNVPHPILVDYSVLNLHPSSAGPQHDERENFIDSMPAWLTNLMLRFLPRSRVGWAEGFRAPPNDAPQHTSVIERFSHQGVLIYGTFSKYRPHNLRKHEDVWRLYEAQ